MNKKFNNNCIGNNNIKNYINNNNINNNNKKNDNCKKISSRRNIFLRPTCKMTNSNRSSNSARQSSEPVLTTVLAKPLSHVLKLSMAIGLPFVLVVGRAEFWRDSMNYVAYSTEHLLSKIHFFLI